MLCANCAGAPPHKFRTISAHFWMPPHMFCTNFLRSVGNAPPTSFAQFSRAHGLFSKSASVQAMNVSTQGFLRNRGKLAFKLLESSTEHLVRTSPGDRAVFGPLCSSEAKSRQQLNWEFSTGFCRGHSHCLSMRISERKHGEC